jgi:hypothetical protein
MNAGVFISDEMQDELRRIGKKDGSPVNQILTDIKKLYNNLDYIDAIRVKNKKFPRIAYPRLAVFGVGTVDGFYDIIDNSDTIAGGFLSRMVVWTIPQIKRFNRSAPLSIEWDSDQVDGLRALFEASLTGAGQRQMDPTSDDYEQPLDDYLNNVTNKCPVHVPQFKPVDRVLELEPGAADQLAAYKDECDGYLIRSYEEDPRSRNNTSSIHARAPQFAYRVAGVHARGCERSTVTAADMDWAIGLMRLNTDNLCSMIEHGTSDSEWDRQRRRVISWMSKRKCAALKEITNAPMRGIKGRDRVQLMIDLLADGQLEAYQPKDGKAITISHNETKLPRGVLYRKPGEEK